MPTNAATFPPTGTPAPASSGSPTPFIYVVKLGDSLYEIALEYGTTVQAIMQANGLESDRLRVGQQLIIPQSTPTPVLATAQTPTAAPTQS